MIILEGPDNVGKTTAAKRIAELTGMNYRHMTKPGPEFDYHEDYLKLVKDDVVQDRFHLGGLVYGFLCGLHATTIKKWKFRALLQELHDPCFVIVMYQGSDANYAARITERNQLFCSAANIAVNATYRTLARQGRWIDASICHVAYDIDKGFPTDDLFKEWIDAR